MRASALAYAATLGLAFAGTTTAQATRPQGNLATTLAR